MNAGAGAPAGIEKDQLSSRPRVAPAATMMPAPVPDLPAQSSVDNDSWFDPKLTSQSRVEYESKGARIHDVRIMTMDGRHVNVLQSGHRYFYEYSVDFDEDTDNVGFGMMIRTVDGYGIGGAATDFERALRLARADAGSRYRARFDLRWSLTAGVYFLNAGVTGQHDGNHAYSHRLLDALAVRVLPPLQQIATGLVDFDPKPAFEKVDASSRPAPSDLEAYRKRS